MWENSYKKMATTTTTATIQKPWWLHGPVFFSSCFFSRFAFHSFLHWFDLRGMQRERESEKIANTKLRSEAILIHILPLSSFRCQMYELYTYIFWPYSLKKELTDFEVKTDREKKTKEISKKTSKGHIHTYAYTQRVRYGVPTKFKLSRELWDREWKANS